MLYFFSSRVIFYKFNIKNIEGKLGVGYDIIIGRDLMAQLGIIYDFKWNILELYGAILLMKYPTKSPRNNRLAKRRILDIILNNK